MKTFILLFGILFQTILARKNISALFNNSLPTCGLKSKTYCINEKQYTFCNPTPSREGVIFTCPFVDQFCADIEGSCTRDSSVPSSNVTFCGVCSTPNGKGHTCTSLTSFEICQDGQFSQTNMNKCAPGKYCDAISENSDDPCTEFSGRQILCWNQKPEKSDHEVCVEKGTGRYPTEEHSCLAFLDCQLRGDSIQKVDRILCQPPNIFSPDLEVCVPPYVYTCPGIPSHLRRITITASLNPNSTLLLS